MILTRLHDLLCAVRDDAGGSFSGLGILVSASPDDLPTLPLRTAPLKDSRSAHELLVAVSRDSSEFHDGFHVLSPDLVVTHVSMYFSPPIVGGLAMNPDRRHGGRYMAALFGSMLPSVIAAGVVSVHYGVVVFRRGERVSAERS